jgi:hypothetical protein
MFKIKRDLPAFLIGLGIAGIVCGGYYLHKLGKAEAEIETYDFDIDVNGNTVAIDTEGYPDDDLTNEYNELKRRVDVYKTAVKISAVEIVCGIVGVALLDKHLWENVDRYIKAHDDMAIDFQNLVVDKDGVFTKRFPSATEGEQAFYTLGYDDAYKHFRRVMEEPMLKDGWLVVPHKAISEDVKAFNDSVDERLLSFQHAIEETQNEVKFAEV